MGIDIGGRLVWLAFTLGAAVTAAASCAFAQATPAHLAVSGSVRLRYEGLSGQARAGLNAEDHLTSRRTILTAEYKLTPRVRVGGELYDSRAYGGKVGGAIGTGEVNTLELVQAYVGGETKVPAVSGGKLSWQAGRFTLNLGSRRLIAADDYRNTTNGYTGARADLTTAKGVTTTLFYVLPQRRLPDDLTSVLKNKTGFDRESTDLQLWGGLFSKPRLLGPAKGEVAYYVLREDDSPGRPTRNRHLNTLSARLIADPLPGRFDYEVEASYQSGSIRASTASTAETLDVAAYFVHADLGYSFPGTLKSRLSVEYDYVSGDDSRRSYGRFDTLFGMRRADFSPAGIYAQIGRANISTPGVRLELAPASRWDGFIVYRPMWLASRTDAFSTTGVRDPTGRSGHFAGHQIEGRWRYWIRPKKLRAEFNAAYIAKARFLKTAPNAPENGADTVYGSFALTASF